MTQIHFRKFSAAFKPVQLNSQKFQSTGDQLLNKTKVAQFSSQIEQSPEEEETTNTDYDEATIAHLRSIFDNHPALNDYMTFNDQVGVSTGEDLVRYVNSGRYNPIENSDDVLLVTSLMIVLNAQRSVKGKGSGVNVAQLPIFGKIVRDIKNYCVRVHHFDRNFITVGFLFCKDIMPYVDYELMQGLIRRTLQNFDQLSSDQIAYCCLNSHLLIDKDPKNRALKEQLFQRLEEYLVHIEQ